ncbi:hypothetical protein CEXT_173431 [Caerostris extrusa]|uniref:Uncharacterized protein n=1 Tax=Caerostris extrusa TaxID=172846 RepID=A0AAV4Y6B0_CAEEX|nr:hypothetical protein CEXT_173431 [Caerostris extrusa]
MRELHQRYKATEPQEQPERRLEQTCDQKQKNSTKGCWNNSLYVTGQLQRLKYQVNLKECQRIRLRRLATTETREQREKTGTNTCSYVEARVAEKKKNTKGHWNASA